MRIASVGCALPPHYYDQSTLLAAFKGLWGARHVSTKVEKFHNSVAVGGRYLALPMDAYPRLTSFTDCNDAFIRCALDLGEQAIQDALLRARLQVRDIDHLFFVSVTGLATPSIDARLTNRLGLRQDIKRTPIFGLGCVAGAAGVARAADYLRAYPDHIAALLSVELCSLTLQREDFSVRNIIASGLFGDGAAAVLLVGADRAAEGPAVVATRSILYPNTEQAMGWEVTAEGFRVVLSADVPKIVERHIRGDVDAFLAQCGLTRGDISSYICHPGGPKILDAVARTLELPEEALALTWKSLKTVGNLSSASVLLVLRDTMLERAPAPGSYGLMLAMGPGFCTELVLLRW
jgi:alkylresorcinol/alkylpyrone synthase